MKRLTISLLTILGCGLIVAGLALFWGHTGIRPAQAADEPEYIGARECRSCHRDVSRVHATTAHALALQKVGDDKKAILADFSQGAELRSVQFPGDSAARAFTADDVAFVLGTGRYTQSYVFQVERGQYQVFPTRWNVVKKQWEPLKLADKWPDPAYDFVQRCAGCHTSGLNIERARWQDDGVQCEACHGPGSAHADVADQVGRSPSESELGDLRASIHDATDPQVCGQCHSRGATPKDSPPFPVYKPGGQLVEAGKYDLYGPDDTVHWYPSGHASQTNMQFNEWSVGKHAASLSNLRDKGGINDKCLGCHSQDYRYTAGLIALHKDGKRDGKAPEPLTADKAKYGITCTTCHDPHSEAGQPANLVQEPYALCVSCHNNSTVEKGIHHPVQEMYEGISLIPNITGIPDSHFVDAKGPRCQTCHLPQTPTDTTTRASHTFKPVLPGVALTVNGLNDSCLSCHRKEVDGASMQKLIDDVQNSVRARLKAARAAVRENTPAWVTQALDFVEGDGSLGIHNYRYADAILDAVDTALGLTPATVSR